jgi:hypothetical protein
MRNEVNIWIIPIINAHNARKKRKKAFARLGLKANTAPMPSGIIFSMKQGAG